MKNLSSVFLVLLALASCGKKTEGPIAVEGVVLPATASVALNGTHELKANISPNNAADKSLTWTTDKADLATVEQNGVVTGIAVGKAIITATSKSNPEKFAKCEVEVVKLKVTPLTITITPETPVVYKGETVAFKATVFPTEADQGVTWSSKETAKATIDPATGIATGVEAGTTLITATATDGSRMTGEITLTVQIKPETPASNASISAITLGAENFSVLVPAEEATTTVANIPRTVGGGNLTRITVNITKGAAEASIKIGGAAFTQGQEVDFTGAVTFAVTAPDGKTVKKYTVAITPYHAINNPYGIYTVKHLVDVGGNLKNSYRVKNDINLPNIEAAGAAELTGIADYATAGWQPITSFEGGIFNGGGHSINNFYINRSDLKTGLFGELKSWREHIRNLGVNCRENTISKGGGYTGILVGYNNRGNIDSCYTTGRIECNSQGDSYIGGVVGYMASGNINSTYSTAGVSSVGGGKSYAGGVAGYIDGSLFSDPKVKNCYATGSVSSSGVTAVAAGGLVGWTKSGVVIASCYATGNISSSAGNSGTANTGGLVGGATRLGYGNVNPASSYRNSSAVLTKNNAVTEANDASIVTPKIYTEMLKEAFKNELNDGGTAWGREDGKNEKLPYIKNVGVGK